MKCQKIICKNNKTLIGIQATRINFIEYLPPEIAKSWHKVIQQFANSYASGNELYGANKVLNLWQRLNTKDPSLYPLPPIPPQQASELIKNLRREIYGTITTLNITIGTITTYWSAFLEIMKRLSMANLFPALNWKAIAYRPYKTTHTSLIRKQIQDGTLASVEMTPTNFNIEKDSYNTDILVPLSIHLSDEKYLQNYEKTLYQSIKIFYQCAERELRNLKRRFNLGKAYIRSIDYIKIKQILNSRRDSRGYVNPNYGGYIDPETGYHFFSPKNPKLIRYLVAMIHHEMGGIPKHFSRKNKRICHKHVRYLSDHGKIKLLPYLGILSSRTAIPFIVVLLLENPRINIYSLLQAKLDDDYGNTLLLSTAGEEGGILRITVEKPRANSQKHNLLSDKSIEVLQWLIKFTTPVRNYLRSIGRNEEARWLWLGNITTKDHNYGRLSLNQLTRRFQQPSHEIIQHAKRTCVKKSRIACFIRRHKELQPWVGIASLKALRVSKGVEVWFRSNGDLTLTAQAFGHKNLQVTLNNYIPQPIQTLMYERQIRRWQNLLICSASIKQPYLLEITDFTTTEQLHGFLSNLITDSVLSKNSTINNPFIHRLRSIIELDCNKIENTVPSIKSNAYKVLLINDPKRLAILLLYREKLLITSTKQLDQPDSLTKSTPRMWLELGNALTGKLLDEQWELRELVSKAQCLANKLRKQTKFTIMEKK